jgi:hypothetical protein
MQDWGRKMGTRDCDGEYSHAFQPVSRGRRLAVAAAIALTLGLAGCVPSKIGPTVQVMPGTGKSFEAFQADQAVCEQYANDQVKDARKEANQQAVGTALVGTALGAGLGAAAGNAGAGAAAGGVVGTGVAAGNAQQASQTIQQQYDIAYSQCMYSKGNQVPGYEPAPVVPPVAAPPPPKPTYDNALVSSIQTELARIGLYSGDPDGLFGGRTRGAIKDFQKIKGLPTDGIPTKALLDALKKS